MPRRVSSVATYSASRNAPFATNDSADASPFAPSSNSAAAHVTSRDFNERLTAERTVNAAASALSSYHVKQSLLSSGIDSSHRADVLRRARHVQAANGERQSEHDVQCALRDGERAAMIKRQNATLAAAMQSANSERIRNAVAVTRACAGSDDIRRLTSAIGAAQLNRERHRQLTDKSARETAQREAEQRFDDAAATRVAEAAEAERAFAADARASAAIRSDILRRQIADRSQRSAAEYERFMSERAAVQSIVDAIAADDLHRAEADRVKQNALQIGIKQFLSARAEWREAERKRLEREMESIESYRADVERRAEERVAASKKRAAARDTVLEALTADIARRPTGRGRHARAARGVV